MAPLCPRRWMSWSAASNVETFDLVAVGRAVLADPAWADKVRRGRTEEMASYDPEMRSTLF